LRSHDGDIRFHPDSAEIRIEKSVIQYREATDHKNKVGQVIYRYWWDLGPTKTGVIRDIQLKGFIVEILTRYTDWLKQEMEARRIVNPHNLLFPHPSGDPMTAEAVLVKWHAYLKDRGLRRINVYDLRHTHATRTFEEIQKRRLDFSKELFNFSARLGHQDVETTRKIYIQFCADFTTRSSDVSTAAAFPEGLVIKLPDPTNPPRVAGKAPDETPQMGPRLVA
jgi:integrase